MTPPLASNRELGCSATFLTKKSSSVSRIGFSETSCAPAADEIARAAARARARAAARASSAVRRAASTRTHRGAMALERLGRDRPQTTSSQPLTSNACRSAIAAARDEPAARQDRHAVAQRLRVRQHVRAEEHGASAIAKLKDQVPHFAPAERIEPRHRLVQKHDFGIVDAGPGRCRRAAASPWRTFGAAGAARRRCRPDRAAPTRACSAPRGRSRTRSAK